MKIIKKGIVPPSLMYEGECKACHTIIEATADDLCNFNYDTSTFVNYGVTTCPVCFADMACYATKRKVMEKYYIELCGCRYQVRIRMDGEREIFGGDTWHKADTFVDALVKLGLWDQVCELATLGFQIIKEAKEAQEDE